jgi:hypothetical protein
MGLTWRDLVSSVTVVVMILAYASFEYGTSLVLLSSARAASAVELVPGSICAVCAAGDLHTRPQLRQGVIFRKVTTMQAICVSQLISADAVVTAPNGGSVCAHWRCTRIRQRLSGRRDLHDYS